MDHLYRKFLDFIDAHALFANRKRILLGVSGGMDSVAMLHLFSRIAEPHALNLAIAHLNHMIRGASAFEDAQFVRGLANHYHCPFYSESVNVRLTAKQRALSLEEAGREMRFDFFKRIQTHLNFDCIALGHHLDDHAETVLMNLARGSGLRGLSGIQVIRDDILHPLLFACRSEIRDYIQEQDLVFREDETNMNQLYKRNRIRHDVVQRIKGAYGESVLKTIYRTTQTVSEAQDAIAYQARLLFENGVVQKSQEEIVLDIGQFLKYFIAIQKETLFQVFQEFTDRGKSLRHTDLQRLLRLIRSGADGQSVMLSNRCVAIRNKNFIFFYQPGASLQPFSIIGFGEYPVETLQGNIHICDVAYAESAELNRGRSIEFVDADKLIFPLVLRSRKEGDKFHPLGASGQKKIHDYFIDEKVPRRLRDRIPILTCQDRIVWVVGHRLDHRFRISDHTRHVVKLEWKTWNHID